MKAALPPRMSRSLHSLFDKLSRLRFSSFNIYLFFPFKCSSWLFSGSCLISVSFMEMEHWVWCTRTSRANPKSRVCATPLFTHLKLAYLPFSLCCFRGNSYSFHYRPQLILWHNQLPNNHNLHSLLPSTRLIVVFVAVSTICLRRGS